MPLMSIEAKTSVDKVPDKEDFHERQEEVGKEGVKGWLAAVLGEEGGKRAWDDLTGLEMNAEKVMEARMKEIEYIRKKPVWKKIPRSMAMAKGWKVIKARWLDVNKGDDASPNYRSRLAAREVRKAWEASVFAPTPPLEALRSVLSFAATDFVGRAPCIGRRQRPDVRDAHPGR